MNTAARKTATVNRENSITSAFLTAQNALDKGDWPALEHAIAKLRALDSGWAGQFQRDLDSKRRT